MTSARGHGPTRRKPKRVSLRDEETYRALFETEPECVKVLDRDGRLIEMNPAGLRMLEVNDLEQVRNRSLIDFVDPAHRRGFREFLASVISGASQRYRFAIVGLGGTRRWMESSGAALRDDTGRITGMIAVTRDITDLFSVQEELHRTAERNRLLFERNPQPMWVYDLESLVFLDVNEAAERQYGYSRDQFLSMTIRDIRPPEDLAELDRDLERGTKSMSSSGLWRHLRKDGSLLDVEIVSGPLVYEGRDARLVAALDVTERRRAERALSDSEARYRELVETMTEVVFEVDLDGNLIYASPVIESILGYRSDEVVGRRFLDLIAPADRAQTSAVVAKTLAGEARAANEYRVVARDGSIRWARSRALPVLRDGRVVGIRGVAVDITDLKAAQEELLATNEQLLRAQKIEAIGRLAGGIAHDFNNLLTVIRGHAELAAEALGDGSPILESISEIQEAGRRATELTRQLLAFGRRQVLQPIRLDLNEKLLQAERLFARILGEDVEIRLRPAPEPAEVVVDPGQIDQVLMNLVVNARDAMPDGGRLILGTSHLQLEAEVAARHGIRPGAYVELRVADTGRGIPAEIQHRLFEPFFTTKETGQGSGLGLSTADGIVRQSGGAISVVSRVGKGSVFSVLLPRAELGTMTVVPERSRWSRRSERVLLIEAEPAVRDLVRGVLVPDGFEVIEARSGPEAIEIGRALREEVDLVICGLETPGSDFLDLIGQLRRRWPGVRLLIGSGAIPEPRNARDLTTGVRFLEKPFTPRLLLEAARQTIAGVGAGPSEAETR